MRHDNIFCFDPISVHTWSHMSLYWATFHLETDEVKCKVFNRNICFPWWGRAAIEDN